MIKSTFLRSTGGLCRALGFLVVALPLTVWGQRGDEPPKNLKVLPQGTDAQAVREVMGEFTRALDVDCSFCHVSDKENARRLDYASDENEHKMVARVMMRMTQTINTTLLPETGRKTMETVTCETCHHGSPEPKTLSGEMAKAMKKDGMDAALQKYRDLRELYYGRAAYDFGEESLLNFVRLLQQTEGQEEAALRVCEFNLSYFPKSVATYSQMSGIYRDTSDNASALESLEKALAIEPDNRWVQRQISRLKEGN